jgi:hypothetical protein
MLPDAFQACIHPDATSLLGHFFGLLFFGPTKKSDSRLGRGTKRPLRKRQSGGIHINEAKSPIHQH